MKEDTKNEFLALKEDSFTKHKSFSKAYDAIKAKVLGNPSLVEGLIEGGFSLYQIILIGELLMKESEQTSDELFKQLSIFTLKKDVN